MIPQGHRKRWRGVGLFSLDRQVFMTCLNILFSLREPRSFHHLRIYDDDRQNFRYESVSLFNSIKKND